MKLIKPYQKSSSCIAYGDWNITKYVQNIEIKRKSLLVFRLDSDNKNRLSQVLHKYSRAPDGR